MANSFRFFLFVPPMLLLITPLLGQLQGRIDLLNGSQYQISVVPTVNWAPPQSITSSAQLTLRAPASRLNITAFQSLTGTWSLTNTIKSPKEAPAYDYFSFSLNSPLSTLTLQQSIPIPLFAFSNVNPCSPVELIDTGSDPFMPPNSLSVNIGNSFSVLGTGIGVNAYNGNTKDFKTTCPPVDIAFIPDKNPVPCNGSSTDVTLKATGGYPPYQVTWKHLSTGLVGTENIDKDGETRLLKFLKAGSYQVIIKDGLDSASTKTIVITQPAPLKIQLHAFDASCNGSMDGVAFVDKTSGGTAKFGYKYYWSTNPTVSNASAGFLDPGTYSVTVVDDNGCQATDSIQVKISAVIYPNILVSQIRCAGDSNGVIDLYPVGVNPPFTFAWSANAKTGDYSSAWKLGPGTYTVTVTDATGVCSETRTITLNDPPPINLTYSLTAPGCGEDDGRIKIVSVQNANGNWVTRLDGTTDFETKQEYTIETGIPYKLTLKDSKGCTKAESFQLPEHKKIFLELGSNMSLKYGQSTQLKAEVYPLNEVTLEWTPTTGLSCTSCPNPWVSTQENITYSLKVSDKFGCSATDKIAIDVYKSRDIFIPNAFSPNHDGINDQFCPYAGFEVTAIRNFQVFDRWGGLIYETLNLRTDGERNCGWDGTTNGKVVDAGTYLFTMYVDFIDGASVLFSGEFTLVR